MISKVQRNTEIWSIVFFFIFSFFWASERGRWREYFCVWVPLLYIQFLWSLAWHPWNSDHWCLFWLKTCHGYTGTAATTELHLKTWAIWHLLVKAEIIIPRGTYPGVRLNVQSVQLFPVLRMLLFIVWYLILKRRSKHEEFCSPLSLHWGLRT